MDAESLRDRVWSWKCLDDACPSSRRFAPRRHRLKNETFAYAHSKNHRGHNVIITHTAPDGVEVLGQVIQFMPNPDYSQPASF